ncbi:MAG: cache domain-containing protein [Elusimicrobiales bacterium]|nr:cache domain-containing protein [Elusimicrobiales bacterium]
MTLVKSKWAFTAVVAVMFLAPFLVLSSHFLRTSRDALRRDTLNYMELRTRLIAGSLAEHLLAASAPLEKLRERSFAAASRDEKKRRLSKIAEENRGLYLGFSILDSSGKEVARTGDSKDPMRDYSSSGVFAGMRDSGASAGAVEYFDDMPPVLVLAEPLQKDGKLRGAVLSRISLARAAAFFRAGGRGSLGVTALLDAGGQTIADSAGRSLLKPGMKSPEPVLNLVDRAASRGLSSARSVTAYAGDDLLVAAAVVPGTRWWVYELASAAGLEGRAGTGWIKRVISIGVVMIIVLSFMTLALARAWLVPAYGRKDGEDA